VQVILGSKIVHTLEQHNAWAILGSENIRTSEQHNVQGILDSKVIIFALFGYCPT
jgi:hypothetical protein